MSQLFDTVLYIPIFNLLVFLYNTIAFGDFGIAIILVTFIVRIILSPLSIKALKSQRDLAVIQPKIKEIHEKFKNDKQKQAQATLELYKQYNINPFSGCFPLLIQLPILIALYRVSISGFSPDSLSLLYSFISKPETLHSISLGFIDLTQKSVPLAIIAGVVQFIQSKLSLQMQSVGGKSANPLGSANKQILYFFPIITIIISLSFPAGLPLYWIATTVFSLIEQVYIKNKFYKET